MAGLLADAERSMRPKRDPEMGSRAGVPSCHPTETTFYDVRALQVPVLRGVVDFAREKWVGRSPIAINKPSTRDVWAYCWRLLVFRSCWALYLCDIVATAKAAGKRLERARTSILGVGRQIGVNRRSADPCVKTARGSSKMLV
jgi:hypothetical protein